VAPQSNQRTQTFLGKVLQHQTSSTQQILTRSQHRPLPKLMNLTGVGGDGGVQKSQQYHVTGAGHKKGHRERILNVSQESASKPRDNCGTELLWEQETKAFCNRMGGHSSSSREGTPPRLGRALLLVSGGHSSSSREGTGEASQARGAPPPPWRSVC
jgi:hypothetical protein